MYDIYQVAPVDANAGLQQTVSFTSYSGGDFGGSNPVDSGGAGTSWDTSTQTTASPGIGSYPYLKWAVLFVIVYFILKHFIFKK